MIKKTSEQKEKEISKEKAFKAVYEYAAWGALFHAIRTYLLGFFRFILDLFHSIFR